MDQISLQELQKIRPGYDILPRDVRPENPSGQCAYRKYEFNTVVQTPIYKITAFDPSAINSYYNEIRNVNFKSMDEKGFFKFVQIALSLKRPDNGEAVFQAPPYDVHRLCKDYNEAQPTNIGSVAFKSSGSESVHVPLVPSSVPDANAMDDEEDEKTKALAVSFLFSWLTRFFVKSPSPALNLQYDKLKSTFTRFYQASSRVFDQFRPDANWIAGLKDAADTFIRAKCTLIFHIASAETYYKDTPKIFNVLRFLYFQNLEFMGMHAYVSIVSIMAKTALPPSQVLTWLRISGAELAIDEAFSIMHNQDNGMIPDGHKAERLWKYARCLDQGYFNRLQTAYAAELMSTLAHIEIILGISSETGYASPLNIYAIANNRHIKEIGKLKAEAFIACKNSIVSLSADASVVDRMYALSKGKGIAPSSGKPYEPISITPDNTEAKKRKNPEPEIRQEKKMPPRVLAFDDVPAI